MSDQRFWETSGTVEATDGTVIQLTVQHVAGITPEHARELFDLGKDVGDWGWKHRVWYILDADQLNEFQAAARFFYGWADENEKVTRCPDGAVIFEAFYAC